VHGSRGLSSEQGGADLRPIDLDALANGETLASGEELANGEQEIAQADVA
jgi:hypothetical protein